MANVCDVTYKIVGDKKQVKEIYKTLLYMEKRKTPVVKNGWGKLWLGCLIVKLGGSSLEKYECRGEILDFNYEDNILTINQSTAWTEQEDVRKFLEQRFPNIKIYYREEESGCEIYNTNDDVGTYFPDKYFLDGYEQQEYYTTIEEAVNDVEKIVGHPVKPTMQDIQEALDVYVEAQDDEDLFYYFHKFSVTNY